ncbi:hypothetical protein [Mycobacterium sp. NPDC006124]|uniref:hypothetical protein n=1 Tax=Mycobacterium sp. NPDC006124 TaxID=3156729 RepID=UPI0033A3845A
MLEFDVEPELGDEPVTVGSFGAGSVDGDVDEVPDPDTDEESGAVVPDTVDVASSAEANAGKAPNSPPTPSATASAPTRPTYFA